MFNVFHLWKENEIIVLSFQERYEDCIRAFSFDSWSSLGMSLWPCGYELHIAFPRHLCKTICEAHLRR